MHTFLIDPKNATKPYNFGFLWALRRKGYPFTFMGYIPNWWGKNFPVKENNLFLPISRGIFENERVQRSIANITQTAEMFFGHLRLQEKLKKDCILHFLWFNSPTIEQYIIPKLKRARLLHTAHNLLPHRNRTADFKKFKSIYSRIDCVVVHDTESRDEFKELFQLNTPIRVIPHGNLEEFYNVLDQTTNKESEIFWSEMLGKLKRPIFLFMGPVKSYKGFEILLDAIRILNEKCYSFSVVVKDKKNIPMKNLYYLSIKLPYSSLGLIYRNTDVVILPHTKISQSVTLFEAGYFEKPVIVSSVGGFKETVRDEKDGFVFTRTDPHSLSKKMENMILSQRDPKDMGRNFKEHLIREYSWDKLTDEWINLYEDNLHL